MKKILGILFAFVLCITLVGCEKEETPKLAADEVLLENVKYKLNKDAENFGIKYKIASNFERVALGSSVHYLSVKINGERYFMVRIYYYTDKNMEEAIKELSSKYEKKEEVKVGDITYTKIYSTDYLKCKANYYYYQYNDSIYVFEFASDIDLSRLEDIFLKNIVYESDTKSE